MNNKILLQIPLEDQSIRQSGNKNCVYEYAVTNDISRSFNKLNASTGVDWFGVFMKRNQYTQNITRSNDYLQYNCVSQ